MKCGKCNTRNNYYHNFCYYCGAKMDAPAPAQAGNLPGQEPVGILLNKRREWFNPYRDRKIGKKRMLLAVLLSTATMAILILWRTILA